jgi:hypothetical protein
MNSVTIRAALSLRICAIIFAVILGLQATWILAAELARGPLPFSAGEKSEIEQRSAQIARATAATRIGWPRGDLWADYALAVASNPSGAGPATNDDGAKNISERALAAAPYDARVWLSLAAINARAGWNDDKTLAQLKMSYYTAPNDTRLIAGRIALALQSQAIADDELQTLVAHEIRTILTRKPELKPMIVSAYRTAPATARAFIEDQIGVLDQKFLTELRTAQR